MMIGTFFREIGFGGRNGARDHPGIGRKRLGLRARRSFTIATEIGFKQIALGGGFALE
jgi:hypothetical protein